MSSIRCSHRTSCSSAPPPSTDCSIRAGAVVSPTVATRLLPDRWGHASDASHSNLRKQQGRSRSVHAHSRARRQERNRALGRKRPSIRGIRARRLSPNQRTSPDVASTQSACRSPPASTRPRLKGAAPTPLAPPTADAAESQSTTSLCSALRPQAEAAVKARMRLLSDEDLLFSKRRGAVERRCHAFVAMEDRQAKVGESPEIRARQLCSYGHNSF